MVPILLSVSLSVLLLLLGIFIYPLEENSIVVGFEAMISSQIITLQIKDKAKIEDCYLDCCNTSNGALQSGSGKIAASPVNIFVSVTYQIAMCKVKGITHGGVF